MYLASLVQVECHQRKVRGARVNQKRQACPMDDSHVIGHI